MKKSLQPYILGPVVQHPPQPHKKKEKKIVFQNSQKQHWIMKIRQSRVTLEMGSTEPLKSKSQPPQQREQKHETENKNNWRVTEGGRRAALALVGAVTEVTGGQLHFGVVNSHRSSLCSKKRTSVYTSPLFRNVYFAKT